MIVVKTAREIQKMQDACTLSARALKLAGEMVEPGVSTLEIDTAVKKFIEVEGGIPSTLGYEGYPASTCISVNSVVVHGIPSKKTILRQGDIVSIDIMAGMHGYHGDNAYTYPCGDISKEAQARQRKAFMRESRRRRPAIASAISAALCSGMSNLVVTGWYGILPATA